MKAKMIHKKWEKIISCLTATAIMLQLFLPLSLTAWAKEGQERTEEEDFISKVGSTLAGTM